MWPLPTCVEFSDVLSIPQQRSELGWETVVLQAMLQPQLRNGTLTHAVSAALAILLQVDELGGKEAWVKTDIQGFPGGTVVKNPPANAGDTGSSPGPGRSDRKSVV